MSPRRSSSITTTNKNVNHFYMSGFFDAESTFILSIVKRSYYKVGWGVYPIFKVELHSKDLPLLNQIKSFFGVGTITVQKTRDSAYYS